MLPMKVNFTALLLLIVSSSSYAEPGNGQGRNFTSGGVLNSPGILQRLLEFPDVRKAYDDCKGQTGCLGTGTGSASANGSGENSLMRPECQDIMSNCVWAALGPTKQGQLLDALNSLEGSGRGGAGQAKNKYEGLDIGSVSSQSDRAFIPMRDFFKKQLEEALYGDVSAANTNTTDHAVFLKIYETRISKNLVETIASFCMDIDPAIATKTTTRVYQLGTTPGSGSGSREAYRIAHGALLASGDTAGRAWGNCARDMRYICTYKTTTTDCPNQVAYENIPTGSGGSNAGASTPLAESGSGPKSPACAGDGETQAEACRVEAAIKTARAALISAAELKTAYANNLVGGNSFQGLNTKIYTGGGTAGEKSIDEISTITSKDVETVYGSGASEEAARVAQACKQASQRPGAAGGTAATDKASAASSFDAEACQRYVMTEAKAKEAEAGVAEYALRSKVMQERMTTDLTKDTSGENLSRYLKETGLSESEISAIQSDDNKRKKAVASIISNYEVQRLQIIADMQKQIKEKKSAQGSDFNETTVADAARTIQQELASEPERYKRVTHYSNLITVFLQKSGGDITFAGSASADRELGNSALDSSTNTQIRTNLSQQGLGGGGGTQAQQSLIKGQDLNNILIDLK